MMDRGFTRSDLKLFIHQVESLWDILYLGMQGELAGTKGGEKVPGGKMSG